MENKDTENINELQDFSHEAKNDILDVITDCPSLVKLGEKEYAVKNLRTYSVLRICRLAQKMKSFDGDLDNDNKILTSLCTDLDSMCEIMAVILCNHLFTAEGNNTYEEYMTKNDRLVSDMKYNVLSSTFDMNQWAAIIVGAIKSIDWNAFFLLTKSVNMATDSLLTRKKKSAETASLFMEAQSLQMRPIS